MGKIKFKSKPNWKWLFTTPFGLMTFYNIFRQEINPNLPPLINFVKNWHWIIWLFLLLLVSAIIVIEGLLRRLKEAEKIAQANSLVRSEMQKGGVTAGHIETLTVSTVNSLTKDVIPPNIVVGLSDENGRLSQKMILHLQPKPEKPDIEELLQQKRIKLEKRELARPAEEVKLELPDYLKYFIVILIHLKLKLANYQLRIEEYLNHKYRNYLEDNYQYMII